MKLAGLGIEIVPDDYYHAIWTWKLGPFQYLACAHRREGVWRVYMATNTPGCQPGAWTKPGNLSPVEIEDVLRLTHQMAMKVGREQRLRTTDPVKLQLQCQGNEVEERVRQYAEMGAVKGFQAG